MIVNAFRVVRSIVSINFQITVLTSQVYFVYNCILYNIVTVY